MPHPVLAFHYLAETHEDVRTTCNEKRKEITISENRQFLDIRVAAGGGYVYELSIYILNLYK